MSNDVQAEGPARSAAANKEKVVVRGLPTASAC